MVYETGRPFRGGEFYNGYCLPRGLTRRRLMMTNFILYYEFVFPSLHLSFFLFVLFLDFFFLTSFQFTRMRCEKKFIGRIKEII